MRTQEFESYCAVRLKKVILYIFFGGNLMTRTTIYSCKFQRWLNCIEQNSTDQSEDMILAYRSRRIMRQRKNSIPVSNKGKQSSREITGQFLHDAWVPSNWPISPSGPGNNNAQGSFSVNDPLRNVSCALRNNQKGDELGTRQPEEHQRRMQQLFERATLTFVLIFQRIKNRWSYWILLVIRS